MSSNLHRYLRSYVFVIVLVLLSSTSITAQSPVTTFRILAIAERGGLHQPFADAAKLRAECQTAMMEHFYEVSRVMSANDGKRYLAWVQQETLLPGQMVPTQPSMKMDEK